MVGDFNVISGCLQLQSHFCSTCFTFHHLSLEYTPKSTEDCLESSCGTKPQLRPICRGDVDVSREGQPVIFTANLFPVLLDVFEQTPSEVAK